MFFLLLFVLLNVGVKGGFSMHLWALINASSPLHGLHGNIQYQQHGTTNIKGIHQYNTIMVAMYMGSMGSFAIKDLINKDIWAAINCKCSMGSTIIQANLHPSSINAMTNMTTIIIHIFIWVHCDHYKGHHIIQDIVPTEGCCHQAVTKVAISENQSTISPFVIDNNNTCSP